jgi:UDP-N-acetylmuramyl tripeptide synthase
LLLCHELGIPDAALVKGLTGFRGDERDNPGRGNWFSGHDVRILVDFAHNEHGMRALTTMLQNVPARRRIVMMGQAGDRPDRDIARMTSVVCDMAPDRVLACALPGYERGRPPMEVPALIRTTALSSGLGEGQVGLFESPAEAAADALAKAEPGDLLVFLALSQRAEVLDQVHRFIRSTDRD